MIKNGEMDVRKEIFMRGRMSKYEIKEDRITEEISRIEVFKESINKIGDLEAQIIEDAYCMSTIGLSDKSNFIKFYPKYIYRGFLLNLNIPK